LPAARAALEQAGVQAKDIDLLVCATVTPDMMFPTSSALLADVLGAPDAGAYDLLAGCTGFMYALVQAYGMMAAGLAQRALVIGGGRARELRGVRGRRRRLHPAPGECPDHGSRGAEAGYPSRPHGCKCRPLWEHVLWFNPAGAGGCPAGRSLDEGRLGVDDGHGRGADMGVGADGVGAGKSGIAFCFPGQGSLEAGMR